MTLSLTDLTADITSSSVVLSAVVGVVVSVGFVSRYQRRRELP